ncbi:MAG: DMT family transporter [Haloarculaceae archaeon]
MNAPRVDPRAALAVAVVGVSTSAILIRWSSAPPVVAAFYRVLFTTLLLAPLLVWRRYESVGRIGRRGWLTSAGAGLALAVHFAVWFESLRHTSVAASVTLVQTQPAFVALGAAFLLGERVTRRVAAGIAIAIAGAALLSGGDLLGGAVGPRPLLGDGLALIGAVMAASYVLVGRSLRQRLALVPYVLVVYGVCTLALGAIALAAGDPLAGYAPREWLLFLAMAVGPGLLGHTLINWSLAHVESSVVSVTLVGEPVGSALLALVLLGEVPTAWTVAGGAVVLAGIVVTARERSTPEPAAAAEAGAT